MPKAKGSTVVRYVKVKAKHHRRHTTVPIAVLAGLGPGIYRAVEGFQKDGLRGATYRLANDFMGYDAYNRAWNASELKYGLLPLTLGVAAHWLIGNKLGLNRALARTGIPLLRF